MLAVVEFGGPLLSPESIETADAPRKMVGSMVVIQAESLADVRKLIESDIYWASNVVSISQFGSSGVGNPQDAFIVG